MNPLILIYTPLPHTYQVTLRMTTCVKASVLRDEFSPLTINSHAAGWSLVLHRIDQPDERTFALFEILV